MFSLVVVNVYATNSRCYFHDINLILMITNVMNLLIKKIDLYILSRFDEDMQCDAVTIRELCESRDSCDDLEATSDLNLFYLFCLSRFL